MKQKQNVIFKKSKNKKDLKIKNIVVKMNDSTVGLEDKVGEISHKVEQNDKDLKNRKDAII